MLNVIGNINTRCGAHSSDPQPGKCAVCDRLEVEEAVARFVVASALKAGYRVSVHDSEEVTLKESDYGPTILRAMFTSDDDRLYLHKPGQPIEWVWFVYGNGGWDVICDYTTGL